MAYGPPILSGDRADGTQQRLRYGLGEFRPYRYKGRPGWDPATALAGWRSADRGTRPCPTCGARPGQSCRSVTGKRANNAHTGR